MRNIFLTVVLVGLFLIPLNATNELDHRRDAHFWGQNTNSFNVAYVMGLGDAFIFCNSVFQTLQEGLDTTYERCSLLVSIHEKILSLYVVHNITYNQIQRGIDELYKDYRNERIPVIGLLQVVKMELEGKPETEIDSVLREQRRISSKLEIPEE